MATDETKQLRQTIERQKETLRQLQMVKMYRKKNDLAELERLIDKWRGVCQEALLTLQNKMPEPTPHLTDLINNLNLDLHILRYNVEDEDFDS